jgi:hypothetical protein
VLIVQREVLYHSGRKKRIVIYQVEGFEAAQARDVGLALRFAPDVSCVLTCDMGLCDNERSLAMDGEWTRVPNFGSQYDELIREFCEDDGDYGATVGMPQVRDLTASVDESVFWKVRFT